MLRTISTISAYYIEYDPNNGGFFIIRSPSTSDLMRISQKYFPEFAEMINTMSHSFIAAIDESRRAAKQ